MALKRPHFLRSLLALLGAPLLPSQVRAAGAPADLVVTGATVHTVDDSLGAVEAFAIRGGRFVFAGETAGAMRLRGDSTRTIDLSGKTVLPGLIDAHLHLTDVGLALHEVDLTGARSYEEVIRRTVAFAKTSRDRWILGEGWDQNRWPQRVFPTHEALSAAIPDRPVELDRVDGHAILVNAKAMQMAGITKATRDPDGGRIVHDAAGEPTGVFVDNAMDLVYGVIPSPTHEQLRRAALAGAAECHRWGVTGIGEARTSADDLAVYRELAASGELALRNYTRLEDDSELLAAQLGAGPVSAACDGRLWIRGIKLFADGALGSRGAALLAPYSDDPGNRGLLRITQAHIEAVAERALRAGFQLSIHAIGDRANREVLDAYEAALRRVPVPDHRFRVEHVQVITAQDLPRLRQLKLIASMQTTHQISDMGWAQDRLGPERIKGAYAWRSILDTGTIVANGTDAPVEPINTLRTFHAAIARQNEQNQPPGGWYPNQRMTREEALRSMTIWAAYANFQERLIGSISPGKYADFVVMDRDWMTAAPDEIMGTTILATYFNGKRVYDASNPEHTARATLGNRRRARCCARP
jgi:predicted amidohydrolase YtcJ